MHEYRTHNCGELRAKNVGEIVKLSRMGRHYKRPWRNAIY